MNSLPAIYANEPEDANRLLLSFYEPETQRPVTDVHSFMNAAYFFAHFAFHGWNAAQLKEKSLTRRNVPEESGIWLFGQDLKEGEIAASAGYLVLAYTEASNPDDAFTPDRIKYVSDIVKMQLASQSNS